MNHFKLIKQILTVFAKGLEKNEVELVAEDLGISDIYFSNLCEMLDESGFVRGIKICTASGTKIPSLKNSRISLEGLEYLYGNKNMQAID